MSLIIAELEKIGKFVLADTYRKEINAVKNPPFIKEYKKAVTQAARLLKQFLKQDMILARTSEIVRVGEVSDKNKILCVSSVKFRLKSNYRSDTRDTVSLLKKYGFRKLKAHYIKKITDNVKVKVSLADQSDISIVIALNKSQAKKITGKKDINLVSKAISTIYKPLMKKDTVKGRLETKATKIKSKSINKKKVVAASPSWDDVEDKDYEALEYFTKLLDKNIEWPEAEYVTRDKFKIDDNKKWKVIEFMYDEM